MRFFVNFKILLLKLKKTLGTQFEDTSEKLDKSFKSYFITKLALEMIIDQNLKCFLWFLEL